MKKLFILAVIVFLAAACGFYLPDQTVYLSPPPDVLYDSAVAIVEDMGFAITKNAKEPTVNLTAMLLSRRGGPLIYTLPNFNAEKKDEASGETIGVHVYFERVNVDTIAHVSLSQAHGDALKLGKIRDEIIARLRTIKK